VVVRGVSSLDIPTLRGNPFDSRPIERNRAAEIVGRQEILIRWKEHMHSQSPRLILLSGERGSGRTSLINAISSQTNERFIGTYWHSEDPLNCALDELTITFCGFEVPPTMHQKVERVVETLDSSSGPLPLVALDYPAHVDVSSFLPLILPILQRFRALVIISLSNSQLTSLDDGVREVFDEYVTSAPFSNDQIQTLCNNRIRKMSPEKWNINEELLEAISSRTGGNARSVVSLLRDLVDERRNMGKKGTLESLTSWNPPEIDYMRDNIMDESINEDIFKRPQNSEIRAGEEISKSVFDFEPLEDEEIESDLGKQEDWDVEANDTWEEEELLDIEDIKQHVEVVASPRTDDDRIISDWSMDDGTALSMEAGTEPPDRDSTKGFFGLVHRSRITNDEMPTGPDDSVPIRDADEESPPQSSESVQKAQEDPAVYERRMSQNADDPRLEEKQVLFSEGELWTVDSELEDTLPEIQEHDDLEPEDDFPETEIAPQNVMDDVVTEVQRPIGLPGPKWKSEKTVDTDHLYSMNDGERLVVSIATSREISPSDAEIQARLEVGRPRLSQIYNSLHKSGILAVRKQGRSRLFKISEAAGELLGEGC
tara:strand:+ start:621 stop:2414 length:1794 start_codon:yes stop_codon:yes gene_type:complete